MSSLGLIRRKRLGNGAANPTNLPLKPTTRLPQIEQNLAFNAESVH